MAHLSLDEIEAGQAQLSSAPLQAPEDSIVAATVAEFLPKQQLLCHIGATSHHRLYAPGAMTSEGPAQLSAEQMTPRVRSFLLPPLAKLSHADYLRRAAGSEDHLSEESWDHRSIAERVWHPGDCTYPEYRCGSGRPGPAGAKLGYPQLS